MDHILLITICNRVKGTGRLPDKSILFMAMSGLSWITIGAAGGAIAILTVYWVKNPALTLAWRLLLFLSIAVLPSLAAGTSTVYGLEKTTQREFCGSCHVMDAHVSDATDPSSQSLAARHTRNEMFGGQSCYKCHANYGMNGYVLTKLDGMNHVRHYYFGEYGDLTLAQAVATIRIKAPFPNSTCLHCHAGTGKLWQAVPDHRSAEELVRSGRMSCASSGCHGSAHPFSKVAHQGQHALAGDLWGDFKP